MTYRFAVLLILYFISIQLYCQQAKIDSLTRLLESEQRDTVQMKILLALSEIDEDSVAHAAANSLGNLAKENGDQVFLAKSYRALGVQSNEEKNLSKTISYFDSAQMIFDRFELVSESIEVEYRKAKAYYYSSNTKKASDSFMEVLSFYRMDNDTAGIINTTAWLYMCNDKDILKGIAYSKEGYMLAQLIDDKESAMMCGNNLGIAYKDMGEPVIALKYYKEVLEMANEMEMDLYRAYFLENIGVIYSNMGNYREALEYYFDAMEIYESQNDLEILNDLQINVGVIYKKNQEYNKALEAYRKYLSVNILKGDTADIVKGYLNLGSVFIEINEFDSAKNYLQKAYDLRVRVEQKCFGEAAAALGDLYYQIEELDSALLYFQRAIHSIDECEYLKILPSVTYGIGRVYRDRGDYMNALKYFSQSYTSAVEANAKLDIQKASQALYEWHRAEGNSNQALKYLEVFKETTDSLFNQENTRKMAWLEANYQMDQVADSLTQVKENEARIFNATIEDQQKRQILIVIVSVALLIILFALYLYLRKRRELKYQFSLSAERDAGFKAVITATEEERKRIAKDLHDGVVQQIAAVKLTLSNVVNKLPKEQADEVTKAKDMAEAAAEETRNLSHQMMPKVLIEVGLIPAMEEVINNHLIPNKLQVDFQQHGLKERYENRIEIAVYRIFQELVNNIIKHSNAQNVDVQLMENGGKLLLIVEDDGVGMKKEKNDGIGLNNIKSRLTTIDGKVDYASGASSGTVATIVIPL